jgi:hypothetical protein
MFPLSFSFGSNTGLRIVCQPTSIVNSGIDVSSISLAAFDLTAIDKEQARVQQS